MITPFDKLIQSMGFKNQYTLTSPDKNVEAVRTMLLDRSNVGLSKYGVTTERDDLSKVDWMIHAQEEALDFAVYLEKLIQLELNK